MGFFKFSTRFRPLTEGRRLDGPKRSKSKTKIRGILRRRQPGFFVFFRAFGVQNQKSKYAAFFDVSNGVFSFFPKNREQRVRTHRIPPTAGCGRKKFEFLGVARNRRGWQTPDGFECRSKIAICGRLHRLEPKIDRLRNLRPRINQPLFHRSRVKIHPT